MEKLVDFSEAPYLNRLRHAMGAELIQDFVFHSGLTPLNEEFIRQLGNEGVDIRSDEISIESDGTISCKNQRIVIYIRDASEYWVNRGSLPSFHVAFCSKLQEMTQKGKWQKYVAANRDDGVFSVNIIGTSVRASVEKLVICRCCLRLLDWFGYGNEKSAMKKKIVDEFLISKFFEKYPKSLLSVKPTYDADTAPLNQYATNQQQISKDAKRKANYRCTNCRIELVGHYSRYLHVHHIDGQKHNNKKHNLRVLCVKCHANEPDHGHMKSTSDYKEFLVLCSASSN